VAGDVDGTAASAADRITQAIDGIGDWRGEVLRTIRRLIHEADPDVVEEVKWVKPTNPAGVPTWTHDGIICTGEVYKAKVKLTFANGAAVPDPANLFVETTGGTRRAIDLFEGDELDARAFTALVQDAVAFNVSRTTSKAKGRARGR
jgi:hypothetical protein